MSDDKVYMFPFYINVDDKEWLSFSFQKEEGTRFTKKRALKWLEVNKCEEKGPCVIEDAV